MCLRFVVDRPECVLAKGIHMGHEWVVVHNNAGFRCGYVRVPVGHPWHGKDLAEVDADVHGGITFAEPDKPCDKPGADDAYWVGFDCCHGGDGPDPELPSGLSLIELPMFDLQPFGTVRTQEYVEAECRSLCEQAASARR